MSITRFLTAPSHLIEIETQPVIYNNVKLPKLKGCLICPPSVAANPDVIKANTANANWIAEKNLLINKTKETIQAADFAGLISSIFYKKSIDDFVLAANVISVFIIFDDFIENNYSTLKDELGEAVNVFTDIVDGKYEFKSKIPSVNDFPFHEEFCSAFYEIYILLSQSETKNISYFALAVRTYFLAILEMPYLRESKLIEDKYMEMRLETIGLKIAFELCCILNNTVIPDEVRTSMDFNEITTTALSAIIALNDIVSFEKELQEKSTDNLIIMTLNKSSNHFDEIYFMTFEMLMKSYNEKMLNLLKYADKVSKSEPLSQYYSIVLGCARDCVNWHFKGTGNRYGNYIKFEFKENKTSNLEKLSVFAIENNNETSLNANRDSPTKKINI